MLFNALFVNLDPLVSLTLSKSYYHPEQVIILYSTLELMVCGLILFISNCFAHSHTYHQPSIAQNRIPNSHQCEIGEAEPESVGDIASQLSIYITMALSLV